LALAKRGAARCAEERHTGLRGAFRDEEIILDDAEATASIADEAGIF